jgi:hypothetical protein
MKKKNVDPSSHRRRRNWVTPELLRLDAGRAELAIGPSSDGPNNS